MTAEAALDVDTDSAGASEAGAEAADKPGASEVPKGERAAVAAAPVQASITEFTAEQQAQFGKALGAYTAGVGDEVAAAARDWFVQNSHREPIAVTATHRFNFGDLAHRRPEVAPYLDHLGNVLASKGATQTDIDQLIAGYDRMRVDVTRHLVPELDWAQKEDEKDASAARRVLREEWGPEYTSNMRLLRHHFERLPDAEREALEYERGPDGVLRLNDPEYVREFAKRARGGGVGEPKKAGEPAAELDASEAEEFAELKAMMGNQYSEYWRGAKAEENQARYRDLVRRGHGR